MTLSGNPQNPGYFIYVSNEKKARAPGGFRVSNKPLKFRSRINQTDNMESSVFLLLFLFVAPVVFFFTIELNTGIISYHHGDFKSQMKVHRPSALR